MGIVPLQDQKHLETGWIFGTIMKWHVRCEIGHGFQHLPVGEKSMKLAAPGNDCDAGLVNFAQKFPSSLGASVSTIRAKIREEPGLEPRVSMSRLTCSDAPFYWPYLAVFSHGWPVLWRGTAEKAYETPISRTYTLASRTTHSSPNHPAARGPRAITDYSWSCIAADWLVHRHKSVVYRRVDLATATLFE